MRPAGARAEAGRATRPSSTSTAARSASTATGCSTSSSSRPAPATASVYANPRGSSGYSRGVRPGHPRPQGVDANPGSGWGGVDFEDVMAVVDAAVEPVRLRRRGPARRAGRLLRRLPDQLGHRAHRPVQGGGVGTGRQQRPDHDLDLGHRRRLQRRATSASATSTIPSEYLRQSPVSSVRDITTPVLILHSEEDWRCPVSQAEELWVALHLLAGTSSSCVFRARATSCPGPAPPGTASSGPS